MLKVTPQVVAPGAESAVYDCLAVLARAVEFGLATHELDESAGPREQWRRAGRPAAVCAGMKAPPTKLLLLPGLGTHHVVVPRRTFDYRRLSRRNMAVFTLHVP